MLQEKQNEAVRQQQALREQQEEEEDEEKKEDDQAAGAGQNSHKLLCQPPQFCFSQSSRRKSYQRFWLHNCHTRCAICVAGPVREAAAQPSEEDIMADQENEEVLVSIMQARFLSGEDTAVNYKEIDNDVSLDNDWALQADQDAQDKYFESD